MSNDEIVLKPCPFCGSTKIEIPEVFGDQWALCSKCGASTAMRKTRSAAAKKWNTRNA